MMVWFVVAFVMLVFLPLGVAMSEHFILGSDHFEDFCKRVAVFDTLDHVYRPFVNLFR